MSTLHMRADVLREHMRTHHHPYDDEDRDQAVSEHRYRRLIHEQDHANGEGIHIPHTHDPGEEQGL